MLSLWTIYAADASSIPLSDGDPFQREGMADSSNRQFLCTHIIGGNTKLFAAKYIERLLCVERCEMRCWAGDQGTLLRTAIWKL